MVNKKSVLFIAILLTLLILVFPSRARAYDLQDLSTASSNLFNRVRESVEYFFAFKVEQKIAVLENWAEKKLTIAQDYAKVGNNEKVQNTLQNYLQLKDKQDDLLGKTDDNGALGTVEERTLEQQKTMEDIKAKIEVGEQGKVEQVQEQVVNQVAQRIIEVNGPEGQTEFFNKVEHVWAPGTGPGGEAGISFAPGTSGTGNGGVVIEGGSIQFAPGTSGGGASGVTIEGGSGQFAPGTSGGGPSGADIKTVEVKTGGGESGDQNPNPGTSDGSRTWIDP